MVRIMRLLLLLLLFSSPQAAVGLDSSIATFSQGRLSVNAQNVPLASLLREIARHERFTVTISPAFTAVPVTVQLSNVEVEPGLQEILRRAGIANAAWEYRKKPQASGKPDEWELARLTIVAEGHGSSLATATTLLSNKPEPTARKNTAPKQQLSREQFRDPKTNRRSLLGTVEFAQKIDGLDRRVLDAPASPA